MEVEVIAEKLTPTNDDFLSFDRKAYLERRDGKKVKIKLPLSSKITWKLIIKRFLIGIAGCWFWIVGFPKRIILRLLLFGAKTATVGHIFIQTWTKMMQFFANLIQSVVRRLKDRLNRIKERYRWFAHTFWPLAKEELRAYFKRFEKTTCKFGWTALLFSLLFVKRLVMASVVALAVFCYVYANHVPYQQHVLAFSFAFEPCNPIVTQLEPRLIRCSFPEANVSLTTKDDHLLNPELIYELLLEIKVRDHSKFDVSRVQTHNCPTFKSHYTSDWYVCRLHIIVC